MNFPKLTTIKVLNESKLRTLRGGFCRHGCEYGCKRACKPGLKVERPENEPILQ